MSTVGGHRGGETIWGVGVGHRGSEEGSLGQEVGGRVGEAWRKGGPARTHLPGLPGQHCRFAN